MNRRFLGIKLSVYMTIIICLIASFLVWLAAGVDIDADIIQNLFAG